MCYAYPESNHIVYRLEADRLSEVVSLVSEEEAIVIVSEWKKRSWFVGLGRESWGWFCVHTMDVA